MSQSNSKRKSENSDEKTNEKRQKKLNEEEKEESEDLEDLDDLSYEDSDSENESLDEDDEADDEEDDEEDSDEEFLNKDINIDICADPTDPSDFDGIKCLLQRLWLKENVNFSDLSNLLIEENEISTVLRQDYDEKEDEGEEEENNDSLDQVYGVVSLIPFNEKFNAKLSIRQIRNVLLTRIPPDHAIHRRINDSQSVCALVINERFLNLPTALAVPCYQGLLSDLAKQTLDHYSYDNVIMVCKILKEKVSKDKKNKDNTTTANTIYQNPEDELFADAADATYEYSVADQCDGDAFDWQDEDNLYEPFRKVLLLSKPKFTETVTNLKNNL